MNRSLDDIDLLLNKHILNEKRYLQPGLSLDKACSLMGVSAKELREFLYSTHGHSSFGYWVNWYRIADAMDLWKQQEEMTLRETARCVGYDSWVTFIYWFIRTRR